MKRKPHLTPLKPLDIEKCSSISELLDGMSGTSFEARRLGEAFSVLKNAACDRNCGLILTISGALTIAKLSLVFGSLISRSVVQAVVTTGAVVTHSFVEEVGMTHYQAPEALSDVELYRLGLNRIYDAIEPESNLEALEKLASEAFSNLDKEEHYGSFEIVRHLSKEILGSKASKGLLASALNHKVNVYVPALTDSELGLFLFRYLKNPMHKQWVYDPLKDLEEYGSWMCSKKRIAFLTLGGGVPRNWGQQMLPFLKSQKKNVIPKAIAGVRICPDPVTLGHLSGSPYSEGITWGKFDPKSKQNFVEVHGDAAILFPILAKALIEFIDQSKG